MKKIIGFVALTIIFFASFKHEVKTPQDDSNNSTTVTGNFIITKFTDGDGGEDKTSDFNGYAFVFTADRKISALKNGVAVPGSYTKKPSHEGEGAKLDINFSDAPLNELNKNWLINFISDEAIHLRDDNASSGEVLEFTAQ